ncbi:MAG: DUF6434 domain-containing protein [Methanosphaera sp.]|nr:DUF6434 domain-containing protein [Methanosphaera sp.]
MNSKLNKNLTVDEFREYYFLKKDLVDFCRSEGLKLGGSKKELEERIICYLESGVKLDNIKHVPKNNKNPHITMDSFIGEDFVCSQKVRLFFEEKIGSSFKFKVAFQKWLKNNPDKTFRDAIIAYHDISGNLKKNSSNIDSQFQYNQYIRDFFKSNEDKSFKDAVKCWNYKKNLKGSHKYEDSDLIALKKD